MKYNIKELDTTKCLYDPKKDLEKLYKDVPEFDVDIDELDKDSVTRFVILTYDFESPIRKEYSKLSERKAVAAQYAGFKLKNNGKFAKEVEGMVVGQYPKTGDINAMIVKYIMLYNDPDLLALEVYYHMLEQDTTHVLGSLKADPKSRKEQIKNIKDLSRLIEDLTAKQFGGRDSQELIRELYRNIETVRERLMPEYIADKLEKGEEVGDDPYNNWKKEPLELYTEDDEMDS